MINEELISQEFLETKIKDLKKWYTEMVINLKTIPFFIKSCEEDIGFSSKERKKALEDTILKHKSMIFRYFIKFQISSALYYS